MMKLIMENWRGFLNEKVVTGRALERYATALTRETLNVLKSDSFIKHIDKEREAEVTLTSPLIKELDWVRRVVLHVKQDEKMGLDTGAAMTHGSYEYTLDAPEEERKTADIHVNVVLPVEYDFSVFSELIPQLKDTFRHELEHSGQPTEMLDTTLKKIPDAKVWKTLEIAEQYYTSESETKAHVAGLYKKAKTLKKPAAEIVDRFLGEVLDTGVSHGYLEDEVMPLILRIRERWIAYMKKRYPKANVGEYWDDEE